MTTTAFDPTRAIGTLTSRQREVLALVAKGKTNAEIGDVLGISKDGAKWHLGEILGRLGVDTREEAADAWKRYNGLPYRLHRFAGAVAGIQWLRWLAGGVGAAGLAAVAAVLVVVAIQGTKNSSPANPPASATPSASPSATPAPEMVDGVAIMTPHLGAPADLPEGMAVYLASGCTNCDAPMRSIDRIAVGSDGSMEQRALFSLPGVTETSETPDGQHINSIKISDDGYTIVVGICENGGCGGLGQVQPGAQVRFVRSTDGGLTWNPIGTVSGAAQVFAIRPDGAALIISLGPGTGREYRMLPGDSSLIIRDAPPEGATIVEWDGSPAYVSSDGRTLMDLSQPGQVVFAPELPPNARMTGAWRDGRTGVTGISWTVPLEGENQDFVSIVESAQAKPSTAVRISTGNLRPFQPGGWASLDKDRAITTVVVDPSEVGISPARDAYVFVPMVIDLRTGEMRPLRGPVLERAKQNDRSLVLGVLRAPAAEVTATADCLNVRAQPSIDAESRGCFADGTLLTERGLTKTAGGQTWVAVYTPRGEMVWAAGTYLRTTPFSRPVADQVYGPDTRTGNAEIDPVLRAIASGDPGRIVAATHFMQIACVAKPQEGIAAPPLCGEGLPDGTLVDVMPGAGCEGFYQARAAYERQPIVVPEGAALYAIYRVPASDSQPDWPLGDYTLVYMDEDSGLATRVSVRNGTIVNRLGGCGQTAVQIATRVAPTDFILPPK